MWPQGCWVHLLVLPDRKPIEGKVKRIGAAIDPKTKLVRDGDAVRPQPAPVAQADQDDG